MQTIEERINKEGYRAYYRGEPCRSVYQSWMFDSYFIDGWNEAKRAEEVNLIEKRC